MTEIVPGGAASDSTANLLVVPVFADLTWGPGAESAAEQLGPWLSDYLEAREFTGAVRAGVTTKWFVLRQNCPPSLLISHLNSVFIASLHTNASHARPPATTKPQVINILLAHT